MTVNRLVSILDDIGVSSVSLVIVAGKSKFECQLSSEDMAKLIIKLQSIGGDK